MRLAASLCNLRPGASAGIVEIDLATETVRGVPAPAGATSVTGLCVEGAYLYAAFHRDGSWVAIYDAKTLEERAQFALSEASDIHSIDRRDNTLLSVSSGTDSVVRHTLLGTGARFGGVAWSPIDGQSDTIHLNAVTRAERRCLISGFGPRRGGTWNGSDRGFVYDLEDEDVVPGFSGIHHPHSVQVHAGAIYCLESVTGAIVTAAGRSSWTVEGYARGLCFIDGRTVAIGTSAGRNADVGGACGVVVASLTTGAERTFSLAAFNDEIYDVVALP